jgi:hypothetical protein
MTQGWVVYGGKRHAEPQREVLSQLMVAANYNGMCYVWRLQRGTHLTTHFEPFHKLNAHNTYILKCLISPDGR